MKTLLTVLMIAVLPLLANAQKKVTPKDIIGTWKMEFNVGEELEKEADKADNMLEEIMLKSIGNFVGGILEDIDIYFTFEKDNEVVIRVEAYDEKDKGRGIWRINRDGGLEIRDLEGDMGDITIDAENDTWFLKDGKLVHADDEDDDNVFMKKID